MFQYLRHRETGLHPPSLLEAAERKRRWHLLELSTETNFEITHTGGVTCVKLDPAENRYLLSSGADAQAAIFDTHQLQHGTSSKPLGIIKKGPPGHGHRYSISAVEWYVKDNGMFMTGSMDHLISVWDANSLQRVTHFQMLGKVYTVAMSPCSSHCLVAGACADRRLRMCDLRSGAFTHTLAGHTDAIYAAQWSPASEYVIATGSQDQTVRMWDIRRAGCLLMLDHHVVERDRVAVSTTPLDRSNRKQVAHDGSVTVLHFTPNGMNLLSWGTDNRLRMWDALTGVNCLVGYPTVRNKFHKRGGQMAISPDSSIAFLPSENEIVAFNVLSGKQVSLLRGHFDLVNCVTAHPWKEELYSGGGDCQVLAWSPLRDERTDGGGDADMDAWSDDE